MPSSCRPHSAAASTASTSSAGCCATSSAGTPASGSATASPRSSPRSPSGPRATPEQQRRVADLLLGGGRLASVAYHELAHGNDFVRNEFRARPDRRRLCAVRRQTRHQQRRTGGGTGPVQPHRGHRRQPQLTRCCSSTRASYPPTATVLPRYDTVGVRGCLNAGVDFTGCPLPGARARRQVGPWRRTGAALLPAHPQRAAVHDGRRRRHRTAHRSVLRAGPQALPPLRPGDPARPCHDRRRLPGSARQRLPRRSRRPAPCIWFREATSVYASAVKYLVPTLLTETVLRPVHRARRPVLCTRRGFGVFQKHVRDLPMISLGHAGTAACQAPIIPQLPRLARRSWFSGKPAPEGRLRVRDGPPAARPRQAGPRREQRRAGRLAGGRGRGHRRCGRIPGRPLRRGAHRAGHGARGRAAQPAGGVQRHVAQGPHRTGQSQGVRHRRPLHAAPGGRRLPGRYGCTRSRRTTRSSPRPPGSPPRSPAW